jgi:hypothetical protein
MTVLKTRLDAISRKFLITIVVLDSIAGILRAENEVNDRLKRSKQIHKIGFELSNAARKYNIPFVVINQVKEQTSIEKVEDCCWLKHPFPDQ